jgi:hypothetical protein
MSDYGTGTYGAATYGFAGTVFSRSVALAGTGAISTAGGVVGATTHTRQLAVSGTGTISARQEGGIVVALRARLPLDLFAEVTTHDGTRYRWDANQAPGSRLRNFSFRTKVGEGFADANGQLARRIDLDYPDLGLINTVTLTGADGSVAYEGRLAAMPRDLSDSHSIGVTLAGWMSHAKDRKFSEIYIDRQLNRWQPPSVQRQANTAGAGFPLRNTFQVATDEVTGNPGVVTSLSAPWAANSTTEAFYDAGTGNLIGSFRGSAANVVGVNFADANWLLQAYLASNDVVASSADVINVRTTGSGVDWSSDSATGMRYATIQHVYSIAYTGDNNDYRLSWRNLRIIGNHGLTVRGSTPETEGFYASDVMRDIASRWCPQLDTSGIQDTSYIIEQLAFTDRAFPYDAFLELNKYHLWHIGVWENKRLDFRPYDLTDYDWEIRTDDPGTTFSPQGPSTETLFNGITVEYQDILTGTANVLTPDTNPELADTSSSNPWNQHGIAHWDEIKLSTPDTAAGAAHLGQAALADRNAPKTPGTITVRGYIRDRAGNDQPAWKPRAGDTISITNFPNDSPRLIVETDYNDEDKTLRIAVDRPFQLLEAYIDRLGTSLGARGLA